MKPALAPWLLRAWEQAVAAFESGRLGHALLVCGPERLGKRELAEALAQAREELAQLTGTDTAEDRRAAIERSYRDLRARLAAENDAAGVSLIDRLISVRAAQANLAKLEQEWRLVTERLRNAQEAIQIQQQAGLLTEAQARRQIVALQQQ